VWHLPPFLPFHPNHPFAGYFLRSLALALLIKNAVPTKKLEPNNVGNKKDQPMDKIKGEPAQEKKHPTRKTTSSQYT